MSMRKLPPLPPSSTSVTFENGDEEIQPKKKKKKPKVTESNNELSEEHAYAEPLPSSNKQTENTDRTAHDPKELEHDAAELPEYSPKAQKRRSKTKRLNASRHTISEDNLTANDTLDNENISSEPSTLETHGKKSKALPSLPTTYSSHQQLDETEMQGLPPKQKRKRKKLKGSSEVIDTVGLAADLYDLKEDVVIVNAAAHDEQSKWTAAPSMRSDPTNKLYIEKRNGFKSTDKEKMERQRAEEDAMAAHSQMPAPSTITTLHFALATHRVFKTITLFLQGLFAGIALWHIVSTWLLSNYGFDIFLDYYYVLAMPVQSMYYFLFALCTVAVFDRYDISRPTRTFVLRSISMQAGTISCFFYFAGLIFSLSIASIDDKIGLHYKYNNTLWSSIDARNNELSTWRVLNLMRGLGAILGWMIVSLRPGTDRLSKNLLKSDESIVEPEVMASPSMVQSHVAPTSSRSTGFV